MCACAMVVMVVALLAHVRSEQVGLCEGSLWSRSFAAAALSLLLLSSLSVAFRFLCEAE